jgi:hypothetical protein
MWVLRRLRKSQSVEDDLVENDKDSNLDEVDVPNPSLSVGEIEYQQTRSAYAAREYNIPHAQDLVFTEFASQISAPPMEFWRDPLTHGQLEPLHELGPTNVSTWHRWNRKNRALKTVRDWCCQRLRGDFEALWLARHWQGDDWRGNAYPSWLRARCWKTTTTYGAPSQDAIPSTEMPRDVYQNHSDSHISLTILQTIKYTRAFICTLQLFLSPLSLA